VTDSREAFGVRRCCYVGCCVTKNTNFSKYFELGNQESRNWDSEIEGKTATVTASESGDEQVSKPKRSAQLSVAAVSDRRNSCDEAATAEHKRAAFPTPKFSSGHQQFTQSEAILYLFDKLRLATEPA